jgi:putative ABC transport system permease protein
VSGLDLLLFALRALHGHRLRTALSLFGMSIGVAAVVILTGLGDGARSFVTRQFQSIGSNLVIVVPGRNETTGMVPGITGVPNDLTLQDAEALRRGLLEVRRVAPMVVASASVSFGERRRQVGILGTTHEFIEVQDFRVDRGRFLPPGDPQRSSAVAVLGSETARELFLGEDPLGQRIRIGDRRARVIGVLADRGTQVGVDLNDVVLVPVATAMQMFNRSSLFRILLQVNAYADMATVQETVRETMRERHGELDVTVLTQDSVVSTLSSILGVLTLALVAIAAISLSVAGIGIMNVMLVSVAERTPEIGLLRAVGVKRRQILGVFLTEAVLLSLAGGMVGVAVGVAGLRLLVVLYPAFPAAAPAWAVAAALGVAILAGVVFGVLPARRATRLDPVVALSRR